MLKEEAKNTIFTQVNRNSTKILKTDVLLNSFPFTNLMLKAKVLFTKMLYLQLCSVSDNYNMYLELSIVLQVTIGYYLLVLHNMDI